MKTHMPPFRVLAKLLITGLTLIAINIAPADAAVRIVRLVNDEPITSLDVQKRAKFISVTQRKALNSGLRNTALEELTEEALKRQEARRLGISVGQEQIDQAFASVAQRVKMSPSRLTAAFRSAGVDARTLKKRIEADLLWRRVVRQRFRQEVQIRDSDIQQAMVEKNADGPVKATEFDLQQIVLILPKKAGRSVINTRMREAEAIRKRFAGCADIKAAVEPHRDVVYKRIGRRLAGDLPEGVREKILETPVGKVSPPVKAEKAIQLFAVCDRQEVEDDSAQRREVQSEMMNEQGQILARRLLIDLRQSAVIENR